MKILTVMINYNTSLKTINCIKSLTDINKTHEVELVIVENSTDDKEKRLLKDFIDTFKSNMFSIKYKDSNGNIGYAKAVNPNIKFASENGYDYIWLLNNDLEVKKDCLDMLIDFAKAKPNGIYCSLQKDFDDRERTIGTGTIKMDSFKGYDTPKYNKNDLFIEVDAVLGASLIIDLNIVRETKDLMCENYFIYMEENDYCYRMKLKGYKSYIVMKSVCYHEDGGSGGIGNPLIWYYRLRNLLLFKFEFESSHTKVYLLGIYLVAMTMMRYPFKYRFLRASLYAFYDAYKKLDEKTKRLF